jgi:carnitine-CoA ligase
MTSRPAVGIPSTVLAPHSVAQWARKTPNRIATQDASGTSKTYAELDEDGRRWADAFRRIGVSPQTHVATLLANGETAHLSWLGLGWLRAREVPLNTALVGVLLHDALRRSKAGVLVVHAALADRLCGLAALPDLATVIVVGGQAPHGIPGRVLEEAEFLDGATALMDLDGPIYRDIALVLFTSGTTGPSKPVQVPWSVVYHFWSWVPDDTIGEGEALYGPLPLAHNSGRSCMNYALSRGATFVYRERFSGTEFWDDIRRFDCRVAALVGPMTSFLFAQPPRRDDSDNPLRAVIAGPLLPEVEEFKRRFDVRMATCYGMTETGICLSTGWDHGPWQSCGRPRRDYPWSEVRVVDENDEPLGPGETGELVVRSSEPWALNGGYYGMPEATAEAWRNGWFHTGDAFKHDEDGNFFLIDRMKDAIRRRGENISSFEVESVVRQHDGIADAAAIGVPATHGEDEVMVVVEVNEDSEVEPSALRAWLVGRLPKFMLPRYIEVGRLPRNNTTQRVKKYELRDRGVTSATWDAEAS